LTAGRKYIALGQNTWDEVADPPGTRGRRARRWAHDPDPWINTD
jgi:hypothetical protein